MMPITPRAGGFISITVVTFAAFASGMGVCLFNLDTVGACVDVASTWVGEFKQMGDHLIAWGFAVLDRVKH
ncbi:MAG: hypothetical protein ABL857_03600 [Rickettsiales bacterium]|jgi:hypothetical protein